VTDEQPKPDSQPSQEAAPDHSLAGEMLSTGSDTPDSASKARGSSKTAFLHPQNPPVCSLKNILWVTFFLLLTAATRCVNYRNVFITSEAGAIEQVYFIDGDCYSRMTRVREILDGWGIVHYHAFENYPTGVWPHTTAPMDYLIVALALLLKPFMAQYIDVAGAIVSPILGVMTTAFLALWARELNQPYRKLMLLVVSLSPILVHGASLGRPAHHSLQIFLLAVGIGAELIMVRTPCVSWSIVSGAAWGLALWVSLYEPLVLLIAIIVTKVIFYRSNLFVKERLWGLAVFGAILALASYLEGKYLVRSFSIEAHDQTLRTYFGNWSATIVEMSQVSVFSELLYRWVGFGLLLAPLLLIARLRDTKRSLLLLSLLVVTFTLTLEEIRWGYFFALVYAMSLPWQLSTFKSKGVVLALIVPSLWPFILSVWVHPPPLPHYWIWGCIITLVVPAGLLWMLWRVELKWSVYTLFLLSLWPVARDWDERLFPDEVHDLEHAMRLNDQRRLRQAADFIREKAPGCILAPWWWSPALAYWSGQPAVAGSSHESLSGIVDTSLFFSTTNPRLAEAVCKARAVETVVTGNPENIVIESAHILGQPLPQQDNTMADILWERPHSAPLFLHLVFDNNVVKVFEVNHGSIIYR
jgi:hypothetical protein